MLLPVAGEGSAVSLPSGGDGSLEASLASAETTPEPGWRASLVVLVGSLLTLCPPSAC